MELANGSVPHPAAAASFSSLQSALSALDRLEVRGRDSAGMSVIVSGIDADGIDLRALRSVERRLGRQHARRDQALLLMQVLQVGERRVPVVRLLDAVQELRGARARRGGGA
jgi:hypothetical protein